MPSYNHTREDSARTPCPLCRAVQLFKQMKNTECWCEVGVGNPMYGGRHTSTCRDIKQFMKDHDA